ncbi:hypothetical protein ACFV0L_41590 [Streptosporangium canum]|uniref:hypothetical protein n=1 Tax=Streptosporangium canum TaxID=324952 RepID=UPI0036878B6F
MKAARYLCWLAWAQKGRVALGATLGTLWMVGLTLPPYLLSRTIDDNLAPGWVLALPASPQAWRAAACLLPAE